ncbi:uncharacterized protein SCHCODRAFT_02618609 [Schizophyllum commune H4-8]|nr:uncharacterized protein SCHCODRAFT_02618609 [Schizophyllum commune H4-8]KAI5895112.1 hypothetical protein SCHCODRAFT_02618609 [Schizophyllum commune H4-8]
MEAEGKLSLVPSEKEWQALYHFLGRRGYTLRSRFDPDHVPLRSLGHDKKWYQTRNFEDEIWNKWPTVVDAVRSDGTRCVIRRTWTYSDEIPVLQQIGGYGFDKRNHVVPVLDILLLPTTDDQALVVMPLLRLFNNPPYSRVSEVVETVSQFLECMQFLHEHLIAHRDFCAFNLMMDTTRLIPGGFHFASTSRPPDGSMAGLRYFDRSQVAPMKYFLIDFGLCSQLPSKDSLVTGVYGQDKTVPELSWDVPYSPFKVDIYQFGRVILKDLVDNYTHLEFLRPLSEAMTRLSPEDRPDVDDALRMFEQLVNSMKPADLKRRIKLKPDHTITYYTPRIRYCSNSFCVC